MVHLPRYNLNIDIVGIVIKICALLALLQNFLPIHGNRDLLTHASARDKIYDNSL